MSDDEKPYEIVTEPITNGTITIAHLKPGTTITQALLDEILDKQADVVHVVHDAPEI